MRKPNAIKTQGRAIALLGTITLLALSGFAGGCGKQQGAASSNALPPLTAPELRRQYSHAVESLQTGDPEATVDELRKLTETDPENGASYYLLAAAQIRRRAWNPALDALAMANVKTECRLPEGDDIAEAMRHAADRLASESVQIEPEVAEALLTGMVEAAHRLAKAEPVEKSRLVAGGEILVTVEQGRKLLFERQGRFEDSKEATNRQTSREKWLRSVQKGEGEANALVAQMP
jgi:thioredoxin-like negative regulator of GroEL